MKPTEFILGARPNHAHGDSGCFKVCPVWQYDLSAHKIQFQIVSQRMDEVKECGDSAAGPDRMVILTNRLHTLSDKIKELQR